MFSSRAVGGVWRRSLSVGMLPLRPSCLNRGSASLREFGWGAVTHIRASAFPASRASASVFTSFRSPRSATAGKTSGGVGLTAPRAALRRSFTDKREPGEPGAAPAGQKQAEWTKVEPPTPQGQKVEPPTPQGQKVQTVNIPQTEDEDQRLENNQRRAMQLKKVFKEYGAVGVSFHIGISLVSLGIFYLALSSGINMTAVLCKLGFSESVVQSKLAAGTSTFLLAYTVHKLFAPLRISITLVSVPLIVRYLRKTRLFKPPPSSL